MQRLAHAPELLDGPLDDRAALAGNLRDLRRINRRLGGARLSERALTTLEARVEQGVAARGERRAAAGVGRRMAARVGRRMVARGEAPEAGALSLLDVGTGAADIPLALLDAAARVGRRLTVTAVDVRPEILDQAVRLDPRLAATDGLTLGVADGRRLPFADASFDVAHASLVLHHLEPGDAVAVLRELRRVARIGVVVNDLDRGRLGVLGARLVALLTRNPYTRHDAPLSVRRAYRPAEMRRLLRDAGLEPVAFVRGLLRHRYAIAAAPAAERSAEA